MVRQKGRTRRGLSLLELLVVVFIIALLMSILSATLVKVRSATKSFMCKNKLQTVIQKFTFFADDYGHPYRGRESERLGSNKFRLHAFQDSVYEIGDFAPVALGPLEKVTYKAIKQPMICPAGPQRLYRQGQLNVPDGGVGPFEHISVAMNMRLSHAAVRQGDRWVLRSVTLTSRILDHPWVPLVFDVDGAESWVQHHRSPFYSAPGAGAPASSPYGADKRWFPAMRHGGQLHAGFIGGHVWSSRNPTEEAGWDWQYQPPPDE